MMMLVFKIAVVTATLFTPTLACLPGLGGLGGGSACCGSSAPPPAPLPVAPPVYRAPPAPLNNYVAPPPPPPPPAAFYGSSLNVAPLAPVYQQVQQQQVFGGAYADAPQAVAVPAPVAEPVAALPLLGQPVSAPYVETPIQTVIQPAIEPIASTSQVVMPASAVLEEHIVQPAEVSPNNVVTSIQTGYGDDKSILVSESSEEPQQIRVESASNSVEQIVPVKQVVAEIVPEVVEETTQQPIVVVDTYQQQINKEQATVNELLATLDTVQSTTTTSAPSGNLDFHQVTVQPTNQQEVIIETEAGDDYDAPPPPPPPVELNEDRKDVPSVQPIQPIQPIVPQPVVPEQIAPIIPQPEVHLQPIPTAGIVVAETYTVAYTVAPAETVAPVHNTDAPEQHFENITAEGSVVTTPAPIVEETVTAGADYDENVIISTSKPELIEQVEEEVSPSSIQEYGSKFQKVQKGAETKVVTEPIEIAPYGRFIH